MDKELLSQELRNNKLFHEEFDTLMDELLMAVENVAYTDREKTLYDLGGRQALRNFKERLFQYSTE